MRKQTKKRCADLINTIEEAHAQIIKFIDEGNTSTATALLGDCQDAAVAIGNLIEAQEGEGTEAVKLLEDYCETLYHINEDITKEQGNSSKNIEKKLNRDIRQIQSSINALPIRIEAVFMPYNVTMWDSLESIWMAADMDENCDAYVVPIPYYDRNPDGSFAKCNYDIDKYPDYIPVINHEDFNLAEHHPDMIFIHNPYDEFNIVTSVHPDYYSYRLKKYTDCLVYVPYFATSGKMGEGQALLSAYLHADYIVVQSEEMIEQYDKSIPRKKFLPFGSPKFDRVIRLCKNPPEPPAEWKKMMEGKRIYFYNTSIAGMLEHTEAFLKKMRYVFDTFKEVPDACILWRPHPLLDSSFKSMRPEYYEEYQEIKKSFIDEEIGIIDSTPDIDESIALSDAYIGDAGSSVPSLFGVAGKPVYLINYVFKEPPGEDDWKGQVCGAVRGDRNDKYVLAMGNNLFEKSSKDEKHHFCTELPCEFTGEGNYGTVSKEAGKVIIFPVTANNILIMNEDDRSFHKIDLKMDDENDGAFAGTANIAFSEHPEMYYLLPNGREELVCFNAKNEKVSYISDEALSDDYTIYENEQMEKVMSVRFFWDDKSMCASSKELENKPGIIKRNAKTLTATDGTTHSMHEISLPQIPGIDLEGPKLICIDKTGTRLRAIRLETGEVQERGISLNGIYTGLMINDNEPDVFWFIPYRGTVLAKWNLKDDTWEKVDVAIEGLVSLHRPDRELCEENYFFNGLFHNGKLILSPKWGNKFVELDTHSHEAKEWTPPFSFTTEDKNCYRINNYVGFFYRDLFDYTPKYFYAPDQIIYDLNPEEHRATARELLFDKDEVFNKSKGFFSGSVWFPYGCFENVFNPLGSFIQNDIHGGQHDKDVQIDVFRNINSSPEGDCGDKVFDHLKKDI